MYRSVIALLCIIFVVDVHGAWLKAPVTIDRDAIEVAEIAEKFWSFTPAIVKRAEPLVYCQVIDQCCEEEDRSKAISLINPFTSGNDVEHFKNVMKRCMNTTTSNKENQLCPVSVKSIVPPRMVLRNSNAKKYKNITEKYLNNLEKFGYITLDCNSEEIHAFICSSNTKLVESCAGKILQQIYDYDYKNYEKAIEYIKQILSDGNEELFKVFIKNTNTD